MSTDIITGIEGALGILLAGGFMYASYKLSYDFALKEKNIGSRKRYVLILIKWTFIIATTAFVIASLVGRGGCDSFGDCWDSNPSPLEESWAYFFVLIFIPAMIGLHKTPAKTEEEDKTQKMTSVQN